MPPGAAARAADCITMLRQELSLRRAAHRTLTPEHVRAALTAARLKNAVVHPDLRFAASTGAASTGDVPTGDVPTGDVPTGAASTGAACIVGTARSDPPEIAIAPPGPGGECTP
ncbi:hypothetical protein [Jidongwangia harbinensis]|uniref:hypothetical protein n=1 Tax=Jidongwangia harbinensis TaxID=2878561 RepID=UPI001CD968C8|nr:hypothetical protein [Jidongwangia harbinensis]MCA2212716.1 hypothetical protein [Jidongwangia harbinensis]